MRPIIPNSSMMDMNEDSMDAPPSLGSVESMNVSGGVGTPGPPGAMTPSQALLASVGNQQSFMYYPIKINVLIEF